MNNVHYITFRLTSYIIVSKLTYVHVYVINECFEKKNPENVKYNFFYKFIYSIVNLREWLIISLQSKRPSERVFTKKFIATIYMYLEVL